MMIADESELAALVAELVAIPSVNAMGQDRDDGAGPNVAVIAYVEEWCRGHGIACRRQRVSNGQENLIATLPGPAGGPTIVFDAHTDTVPADDWADRAFRPRIESGRLYGRGACDTKGALAAMMWGMAVAKNAGTPPNTVVLLASADEEYLRTGVQTFLASELPIDYAVVGEPTRCAPVIACKGGARWNICVAGRSAHSSDPTQGINAIVRMASVITLLEEYARETLPRRTHPLTSPSTLSANIIRGGTAVNVVPDRCCITVDLRTLPDEDPATPARQVQEFLAQRLDFPVQHEAPVFFRGAAVSPDAPFVLHCVRCCRRTATQPEAVQPGGVNYGCHASAYAANRIPAVVLGPGDIGVAHATDEYVDLADLTTAAQVYFEIMTTPVA
jgi:acetylornithine deacetylase/succinyl-diaminopimelate desuccinylase-like protein